MDLRTALSNLVGVVEAHELESLDCDRTEETYCDCLRKAIADAKAALEEKVHVGTSPHGVVYRLPERLEFVPHPGSFVTTVMQMVVNIAWKNGLPVDFVFNGIKQTATHESSVIGLMDERQAIIDQHA